MSQCTALHCAALIVGSAPRTALVPYSTKLGTSTKTNAATASLYGVLGTEYTTKRRHRVPRGAEETDAKKIMRTPMPVRLYEYVQYCTM